MVETQTQSDTKIPSLQGVKAASALVEQKAREMVDVLVDTSVKWAGLGLGYGRTALTTSARALDRATSAETGVTDAAQDPKPN
jgi:hypothetical protein